MRTLAIIFLLLVQLCLFSAPEPGQVISPSGAMWGYNPDTDKWHPVNLSVLGIMEATLTGAVNATPIYGTIIAPVGGAFGWDDTNKLFRAIQVDSDGKLVVSGVGGGAGSSGISLEVNGVDEGTQTLIDFIDGTSIEVTWNNSTKELQFNYTGTGGSGGSGTTGITISVDSGTEYNIEDLNFLSGNSIEVLYDGAGNLTINYDGSTDHGILQGLSDDDHTIYVKSDGLRKFSGKFGTINYDFPLSGGSSGQVLAYPSSGSDLEWIDISSGGISGITVSINTGTTYETTAIDFIEGEAITLEYNNASKKLTIEVDTAQLQGDIWSKQSIGNSISNETSFNVGVDVSGKFADAFIITSDRTKVIPSIAYPVGDTSFSVEVSVPLGQTGEIWYIVRNQ